MDLDHQSVYAVGLMSGTSLDGVDAAIVKITETDTFDMQLIHFETVPYDTTLKKIILEQCNPETSSVDQLSSLNMHLGYVFAETALRAIDHAGLKQDDIEFISSHGQTLHHQPVPVPLGNVEVSSTLQVGDISVIAGLTGITTIGDFRTRDMAVGGQGAPLVPYADYLLFKKETYGRVLANIGGISNITVLPKNCTETEVLAYDTGPGNMIIDYFTERVTKGKQAYDKNGLLAKQGKVHDQWLKSLLEHPYFIKRPPKSTGREMFGVDFAKHLWNEANTMSIDHYDRLATLTELTAVTLAAEIERLIKKANIEEVLISGGGRYNPTLMARIKSRLPADVIVDGIDKYGMSADAKEAMIFALLGYQCLNKRPNNLPAATGAQKHVVMGKIAW
ncbi:anhydro-N-acetylmuramic acid kinase [Lentibacillus saliphilus]|uniref:anhydro-N-acetylmuramic acid kinase n=1 Tax=Lentibacillus saliphilus TaxID=2737028 RepID=UPI001C2F23F5|nr:anhydro-N-acetylmuramic acid kinase [Lentibacillus saliphilus]